MHIQVVTFQLEGLSGEEYLAACSQLAPAIAQVPGLISKTFIANPETNSYGGVHVWRDRESMEAMVRDAVDRYGSLDVIFNNAGIEGVSARLADWIDSMARAR